MRARVVGRTYESQTGHLPSHLSQRRPIEIPACLRHITRSLCVVSTAYEGGGGDVNLRMMARHGGKALSKLCEVGNGTSLLSFCLLL